MCLTIDELKRKTIDELLDAYVHAHVQLKVKNIKGPYGYDEKNVGDDKKIREEILRRFQEQSRGIQREIFNNMASTNNRNIFMG